jgi:uncharacterized protein
MNDPFFRSSAVSEAEHIAIDAGLRAHMQRVFNYMAGGLAITGTIAFLTAHTILLPLIFGTPLKWLVIFAPLGFMLYLNARLNEMSVGKAQGIFWTFCGVMGLSMASIFIALTGEDITSAFFITAADFAAMSLWGYTTKKDLTGVGAFLMMGVMGLFIASFINLFMGSSGMQWVVSIMGVAIFTGLTAYDVQRIKQTYAASWGEDANHKLAVVGALGLYLNFINAFQFLLSLMGGRRN